MEWVKVFALISAICMLGALVQILRFNKELKNTDKDQELSEELAGKWKKKLYLVLILGVSRSIFSVITYIFRFLYVD